MSYKFLKLFIRNLLKHEVLHIFNIVGLSFGIVASLIIALYVDHEFNFDSFHNFSDRIYRLEGKTNTDVWQAALGAEHARDLASGAYPEVEDIVQFNLASSGFVYVDDNRFTENRASQTSVNSQYFELFNFEFIEGSEKSALKEPNQVVLTESSVKRYFNDDFVLGKEIKFNSRILTVSGVIRDLPTNSNFSFNLLYTNPELYEMEHFHTFSYLLLSESSNIQQLESKIKNADVAYNDNHKLTDVRLIPIQEIHLSDSAFSREGAGDLLQLNIFIILAILIIIVAAINYINLSFAIFLHKGKEIGIRKIMGESRRHIMVDLASQSILTSLLSIPFIAAGLYYFLPLFGKYMEVDLAADLSSKPEYLLACIILLVTIGLLTIIYPGLAMRQMDVSSMIKTKLLLTQSGGMRYRNALVFFQFVFLFTLGISAWFMNNQIRYLNQKDKGFNPENVVKIGNAYDIDEMNKYDVFKTSLLAHSQIEGVTWGPVMGDGMVPLNYRTEGSDEIYEDLLSYGVDMDYFDVLGINIKAGDFKKVLLNSENGKVVSLVNQSFIERFGWNKDPIGRKITLRPDTDGELNRSVSAVFQDFHFFSFKEKIKPQIISLRPDPLFVNSNVLIRYSSNDIGEVFDIIRKEWARVQPDKPVHLSMMNESVEEMYIREQQSSTIGMYLSGLAIILSITGIVGFMFYILGLKSKEIAIRKILGASFYQIIYIINKPFIIIIIIAGLLGSFLSYNFVSLWLREYVYRIEINPLVFVLSMMCVISFVYLIVSIQTFKSSNGNPSVVLNESGS